MEKIFKILANGFFSSKKNSDKTAVENEVELKVFRQPKKRKHYPNKLRIDYFTEEGGRIFAREIFLGDPKPSITKYRGQVYTNVVVNKDTVYCNNGDLQIKEADIDSLLSAKIERSNLKEDHYYAYVELETKCDEWHPLPSLSRVERLTALCADRKIKLGHSKITNLFYIKAADPTYQGEIKVEYNLSLLGNPTQFQPIKLTDKLKKLLQKLDAFRFSGDEAKDKKTLEKLACLPDEEKASVLVHFIKTFSPKPLHDVDCFNPLNILNIILENKAGVCRHFTIVFMAFAKLLGLEAQITINDVHAYIGKIKIDNADYEIDLGGGRVELLIMPLASIKSLAAFQPSFFVPKKFDLKTLLDTDSELSLSKSIELIIDARLKQTLVLPTDVMATSSSASSIIELADSSSQQSSSSSRFLSAVGNDGAGRVSESESEQTQYKRT